MTLKSAVFRPRDAYWLILALSLYTGFLVARAPASVLAWMLARVTSHAVTLESPSGSFWRGQASSLTFVDRSGGTYSFERPSWNWIGLGAIAGPIGFRIEVTDPKLRGSARIALRTDGVRVSDAVFHLSTSALEAFRREISLAGLTGDLTLRSDALALTRDAGCRGTIIVEWRGVESAFSDVRPLGDYRAMMTLIGARAEAKIETLRGALRLEGNAAWTPEQGLTFRGSVRSEANQDKRLNGLLAQLGPSKGNGIHEVTLPVPPDRSRVGPRLSQ